MGVNTPCMTYSESGQPTGGGPCAEMAALDKENIVMRRQMEKLIDERDALKARLAWTEYDGTEATLPPADEKILLERHHSAGSLFCEAAKPCWHVDAYKGFAILKIGDRWMPWPKGGA